MLQVGAEAILMNIHNMFYGELLKTILQLSQVSHVMKLWYFLSSVNWFSKRACAAIQLG